MTCPSGWPPTCGSGNGPRYNVVLDVSGGAPNSMAYCCAYDVNGGVIWTDVPTNASVACSGSPNWWRSNESGPFLVAFPIGGPELQPTCMVDKGKRDRVG